MISILMPVKNAGLYLEECLDSILLQDYKDWELIAIDDHSSDNSRAILESYQLKDQRVKVLTNSGKGIVEALKTAYAQSKGNIIHRMDADDLMPKDKLTLMIGKLEQGSVVSGFVKYFSSDWMVGLGFQNYENWINGLIRHGNLWEDIYVECPIPSPAWLIYKEDFDRIGGFESDNIPEDYDLCFRMYEHKLKIIGVQQVVHYWRDSQYRTSRVLKEYFPMAYYPLKVQSFLRIDRNKNYPLVLWGAGKKGKLIAKLLMDEHEEFRWITDNQKKAGIRINDHLVELVDLKILEGAQTIIAVASPSDKTAISRQLKEMNLIKAADYWWFC